MILQRRADIDGLRAISVLAVFLYHSGLPAVSGGFVGVDVFFVISGYLIGGQIYERLGQGAGGFRAFLGWFYERRMRRILPAFFFVSALSFVAAFLVFLPDRLELFGRSLFYAALFSGNVFFARQDYFAPDADAQPLLHFWSLGVEEHFYVLFPVMMFLLWRLRLRTVAAVLSVLLLSSLAASEMMVRSSPGTAFYWIPFRAWELLLGSLIALPFVRPPASRFVGGLAAAAGILLVAGSILAYSHAMPFPGIAAMTPCVGAALVIWGGRIGNPVGVAIGVAPMRYVGLISYSLYLVHWPVIVFTRYLYPELTLLEQLSVTWPLSFALAMVSYHFVERPTADRTGIWTRRAIAALSARGVAVLVGLAAVTVASDGFPWRQPPDVRRILEYSFDYDTAYRQGICFLEPEQQFADIDQAVCLPTARPVALLWGDSYAAHYTPALKPFLEQRGFRFAQLNASSCPPYVGDAVSGRPHCKAFNDLSLAWILQQRPALVVMSALWGHDGPDLARLRDTIAQMNRAGVAAVVLGPTPFYRDSVLSLLARRRLAGDNSTVSEREIDARFFEADARLTKQSIAEAVAYISILDAICPRAECPMTWRGVPVHWDSGHLTDVGSALVVAAIGPALDAAIAATKAAPAAESN